MSLTFAASFHTPRMAALVPANRLASPSASGASSANANVVHFSGKSMRAAGKNGVWVSVERIPCKVGGLGEVSKTIPEAIAKYSDKDLRVMVPYMAPMVAESQKLAGQSMTLKLPGGETRKISLDFCPTGLTKQLVGPDGQLETFELLQKFEPVLTPDGQPIMREDKPSEPKGNWVYAIKNDKYFGRMPDLYIQPGIAKYSHLNNLPDDPMFKSVMMFNRAAAAFLPELNASAPSRLGSTLSRFEGDVGFVLAHDWLTGPLLNELPPDYQAGKLFMLHNTFDESRKQQTIDQNRLKVPDFLTRHARATGRPLSGVNPYTGERRGVLKKQYSPLTVGIQSADGVIANANYVRTITQSDFAKGAQFVPALRSKLECGQVTDMHHALDEAFSPYEHPSLKSDGFTPLKKVTDPDARRAEMQRFKKTNQVALQKLLGLKTDDQNHNYVLMNWVARFDPYQKGFYLLMNEAEDFLRKHPNVQLIMVGTSDKPGVDQWVDELRARVEADPALRGRLYLPNKLVNRDMVMRINAGSDFTILPSLYEPYGLTQLESTVLGSIPIVHGVDGLRSTVSDPKWNGAEGFQSKVPAAPEKVWDYGQTGILMKPVDVAAYRSALSRQERYARLQAENAQGKAAMSPEDEALLKDGLPASAEEAIRDAQANFREALERALALGADEERAFQVRDNGMRFVAENHTWQAIVPRYLEAVDRVAPKFAGSRLRVSA